MTKQPERTESILPLEMDEVVLRRPRASGERPAPLRSMRELPHLREQFAAGFDGKLAAPER